MQFKSIITIIAVVAVGNAVAGPLPIAINRDDVSPQHIQGATLVTRDISAAHQAQIAHAKQVWPFDFDGGYIQGGQHGYGIQYTDRGLTFNNGDYQLGYSNDQQGWFAKLADGTNIDLKRGKNLDKLDPRVFGFNDWDFLTSDLDYYGDDDDFYLL